MTIRLPEDRSLWSDPARRYLSAGVLMILLLTMVSGCSIKGYATRVIADTLSNSGATYASDEDIELVGEATPFALKTMELILSEQPKHRGLLLAASKAFTQYAYLYVEWPADQIEEYDVTSAYRQRDRARRLYLRARDYGLRGLETLYPGFTQGLRKDPRLTTELTAVEAVPLLYWTGASWAAAISLGKDYPHLLADLPLMEALIDRAVQLDEGFNQGSLHTFLIRYEMNRQGAPGDAALRARSHFDRAVILSNGNLAAPYVALAQAVSVPEQNRAEFEDMLGRALKVDIEAEPERKLENLAMQQQARWMLKRIDHYITE